MANQKVSFNLQVIDIARTFAILPVLCLHLLFSNAVRPPDSPWLKDFLFLASRNGIYGVFLFFVVSGFLITRMIASTSPSLFKPDLRNFYVRRVARILPLLSLSVIFGVWMVYFAGASSAAYRYCFRNPAVAFGPVFWLSLLTFSFNWYRIWHDQTTPALGLHWDILWSLSIEEQFYLFYPLVLAWLKNETRFRRFLGWVILLSPLSSMAAYGLRPHSFLLFMNSFAAFGSIALGAFLHLLSERHGEFLRGRKGLCACFCGLGFLISAFIYFNTSLLNPLDCVYGPFTFSVGLFFFLLGGLHLGFFESKAWRILALPGKVSFGAYLIHPAVLYFLSPLLVGTDAGVHFLAYILAVCAVAWISFRFYEIPMNHWIRKTWGRFPPVVRG